MKTVADLIERLREFDPDMLVYVHNSEWGLEPFVNVFPGKYYGDTVSVDVAVIW